MLFTLEVFIVFITHQSTIFLVNMGLVAAKKKTFEMFTIQVVKTLKMFSQNSKSVTQVSFFFNPFFPFDPQGNIGKKQVNRQQLQLNVAMAGKFQDKFHRCIEKEQLFPKLDFATSMFIQYFRYFR